MDQYLLNALTYQNTDRLAPFFWLHEDPDDTIIAELHHIYDAGARSVCLESRTHESFCREGWWSDVRLILEECRKLGMHVWILDDKHFPSGYANGIFQNEKKDLQPWSITEKHIDCAGPQKNAAVIAERWFNPKTEELIGAAAIRHIPGSEEYDGTCIDISSGYRDGMIYFDLPEGTWRIVFFIKTRAGYNYHGNTGIMPFCDMLNPETTELFIKEVYEAHYAEIPEYFGNIFRGFFSDEPCFHNNSVYSGFRPDLGIPFYHHPWRETVLSELDRVFEGRGLAYLAGLWFDIDGVSDKVRYAYMDFISREYQKNFCEPVGAWCRAHGVEYIGHIIEDNHHHAATGMGPGHYFRALSGQDMAGVDVVLHQIIPGLTDCANAGSVSYKHMIPEFFNYELAKLASSLAHITPRMQGRAMCEIFGAYGWAESTKIMKYLMDHMLVRGINYFVPHAFSRFENDPDCPPTFYDNGKNPAYPHFHFLLEYLNRMSCLLSDARHIPTCAILYDAENRWIRGSFLPLETIAKKLYDSLLDYDIIPCDSLSAMDKNGTLGRETYPLLLIPDTDRLPDAVADAVKALPIPAFVVSMDGVNRTGLSLPVLALDDLPATLEGRGLRDVSAPGAPAYLRYLHLTRERTHLYMFANEDIHETVDVTLRFRDFSGGNYLVYDGFENRLYRGESADGNIPLYLPSYHSVVILTGTDADETLPVYEKPVYREETPLSLTYKISIANANEPNFRPYKTTDTLPNITGADELPRFAGHVRYETTLSLEQTNCVLDLGEVGESAEVVLNGTSLGVRLFPPYTFDLSSAARTGENELVITVASNNGSFRRDHFSAYLLIPPTGLMGPVTLKTR